MEFGAIMRTEQDWEDIRINEPSRLGSAGMGALRVALLFGSAAIAFGLIIAPLAESQFQGRRTAASPFPGVDMMSTGSIGYQGTYTLRKSVLQNSPESVCIILDDGRRHGDC
jgi:hypothetical protein